MPELDGTGPMQIVGDKLGPATNNEHERFLQEISKRARELSRQVIDQHALVAELARKRREAIAELRAAGLSQRQVAEILGVHHTRISQLSRRSR